ncbi:Glycosyltransferase involved in cell wall bisynthesis [Halopseudomonas litoralis]|uniref:Glycosyltransferase involved in cell wall bisynthesis n=1 Tax=Halopseudomonas litoralis TaxID=797277 RepID=A0A1H1S8E1_9GAMM|nr:glycosyltransferase family 4 protein [Halopseudomonas litoralis]SDS44026.1 Glycosyltransferase involved in cell wall bisynthesis [Halopseudomonas litoralis]
MRIVIHAGLASSLINFRGPLVKALCDAGLEVHTIAPDLNADEATCRQLREWGVLLHDVPLHRAGINPIKDLTTLRTFVRLLREIQPDMVLGYTIKPVIYGTLAARLAKVPKRYALITGLGYAFTGEARGKRKLVQGLARGLYRQALKRTDLVYFQNPDDEALFRELGLVPESVPTRVVNGSGIDTASFDVASLPLGPPRFLLIARLLGDKGVREYVRAAATVRTHHSDIQFRLVGDIDPNPDSITRSEIDEWIKVGHIEYLGRLDDVRPAITDASVYVLPSYREGTPRTVLEAMAMGRAIITTDAPGCRETVVDGDNGFLVPVKDADALAAAMLRFVEQPALVASMGKRARDVAVEKYDVHKVNAQMLKGMGIKLLNPQLSQGGGV